MRQLARRFVIAGSTVLAAATLTISPTLAVDRWITTFDLSYRPAQVTISPGDTVTFVNDDEVPHDAVGDGWSTVLLGSFDSDAVTFGRPGRYPFTCTLHPEMRGTVIVRDAGGGPSLTDPPTDSLPLPVAPAWPDAPIGALAVVWLAATGLAVAALARRPLRRR